MLRKGKMMLTLHQQGRVRRKINELRVIRRELLDIHSQLKGMSNEQLMDGDPIIIARTSLKSCIDQLKMRLED